MNKHSVALILPYYGKFPNYFPLWLKSAGANENFTFMIFTDGDMSGYDVPDNVQVHSMTLEEIRLRAARHLDFEPVLDRPYKLCDYKPMYGLIFQDYLKGYDFWGYVDPDIIWGDMSRFITDEILDDNGKLYKLGHLTIYRNSNEVNRYVLHKLNFWSLSYRDIYSTGVYIGIDEMVWGEQLFRKFTKWGGGYDALDFFDILPTNKQFVRTCYTIPDDTVPAFRWKNGKIYGLSVNGQAGNDTEYLYVHLQKRAMNFTPELEKEDSFLIIPNEFAPDHELTQEEINTFMTPDSEYERAMKAKYTRKGKGIISDIKIFLRMDKIEKKNIIYKYLYRIAGKKFFVWEK